MSEFEDYTSTSCVYDATRAAIGVEVILGCLASARPLATAPELERALATLAQLHAQGRAQEFVRAHDARREQIGQISFLHAVRS